MKGEDGKVSTLAWEKVSSRIMSKMTNGFALSCNGSVPTFHKGKLELIDITVGNRSGNKKVTLVHNLDIFQIDLQEFAHKCQVGVAASTSIHEAPNKKRAGRPNIFAISTFSAWSWSEKTLPSCLGCSVSSLKGHLIYSMLC